MSLLLGFAAVAAGIVAVFVALTRKLPWWARTALIVLGLGLMALPLTPALDFATGTTTVTIQ